MKNDRRDPHKEAYRNAMDAHEAAIKAYKAAKRRAALDIHRAALKVVEEAVR